MKMLKSTFKQLVLVLMLFNSCKVDHSNETFSDTGTYLNKDELENVIKNIFLGNIDTIKPYCSEELQGVFAELSLRKLAEDYAIHEISIPTIDIDEINETSLLVSINDTVLELRFDAKNNQVDLTKDQLTKMLSISDPYIEKIRSLIAFSPNKYDLRKTYSLILEHRLFDGQYALDAGFNYSYVLDYQNAARCFEIAMEQELSGASYLYFKMNSELYTSDSAIFILIQKCSEINTCECKEEIANLYSEAFRNRSVESFISFTYFPPDLSAESAIQHLWRSMSCDSCFSYINLGRIYHEIGGDSASYYLFGALDLGCLPKDG